MNRKEFIKEYSDFVKKHKIDIHRFHVSHGGTMLLNGLREETQDIDVTAAKEVFDKLAKLGKVRYDAEFDAKIITFGNIDVHEELDYDKKYPSSTLEVIEGVCTRTLEQVIKDKKALGRDKDLRDVETIENFLKGGK